MCLFIWLPQVLVEACGIFSCGMRALVPWPGVKPRLPAWRVRSLSHWTTWEVPSLLFGKLVLVLLLFLLHKMSMPLAIYRAEFVIHCCLTNYSGTYFQTTSIYGHAEFLCSEIINVFWLHWVFLAAHELSLVAVSGAALWLWSSLWWLLLSQSTGSRAQAQWLWCMGLVALQQGGLPNPGIEPVFPVLAGRLSTTGPPQKSLQIFVTELLEQVSQRFWLRFLVRSWLGCHLGLQSSEASLRLRVSFQDGCWQEPSVPLHPSLSIGLLECPQDMAVYSLRASNSRDGRRKLWFSSSFFFFKFLWL